jgi:hypothetical protein
MKKQQTVLCFIGLTAKLAFLSLFFFAVCLTGALTERVISLPVMLAGCGALYLVGKWLYHLIPKIDKRIWQMEKLAERKRIATPACALVRNDSKVVCSFDATASGCNKKSA